MSGCAIDPSAMTGIEVCREIRSAHPSVACIMLTSYADDEALLTSIMAGAAGYVLKQIHGTDLVNAVRRVAAGESLLDPATTARVMERLRSPSRTDDPLAALTPRGAPHPGPDRRGADQPADRRGHVPGREDGQELRIQPAREARDGATHASGGVRRPPGREARARVDLSDSHRPPARRADQLAWILRR